MKNPPIIKQISESFIMPNLNELNDVKDPYFLAPGDLAMLSAHYIQKGLLFYKPSTRIEEFSIEIFLEKLRDSLSRTLVLFYPLVGQLTTKINDDEHTCLIYVDCKKGPGVRFVHATVDLAVDDILSPTDVQPITKLFFDHHKAVNHDGHSSPLLSVQVTELEDGVFIGCSMNHAVGDGTSYWNFWNTWSKIHQQHSTTLSLPVLERWFPEGHGPRIILPFTRTDEFITRFEAPQLRERIFHFSSDSISELKKKANREAGEPQKEISSLQALSALVWRAITRSRCLAPDERTVCSLDANLRQRLNPRLPHGYFGTAIWVAKAAATTDQVLGNNLGWTALLLQKAVLELTNQTVRNVFESWMQSPFVYQIEKFFEPNSIVIGSSPRFDMYGNDFGIGKPVAVRSGYANKFPGKVTTYPGREGGRSVDLEICLPPDEISVLESDKEFIAMTVEGLHV
ncbi:uncharacterized acetyltransferase At3g50280-like [Amaranthus tricolor]|uniref:uncharacterized acetyltransferase At3g50280-like n=1 Tax=Amaranthus tricolor TaxID=29722 RepID=UPI00258656D0|nr:uncharacterized acetyltransferase At3g50280-like [Amaranthus tricolor]XP_057537239.1 uncharacterized acetyltransferase At3g50280-like [Amaranthus tricolor]